MAASTAGFMLPRRTSIPVPRQPSQDSSSTVVMARSPKESPPTLRKKLCRLISGSIEAEVTFEGEAQQDNSLLPVKSQSSQLKATGFQKRNSILKTTGHQSLGVARLRRRVHFCKLVTVFVVSDEGDVVFSECRQLNNNPEKSSSTSHSQQQRKGKMFPIVPGCPQHGKVPAGSTCVNKLVSDTEEFCNDVDYKFVNDPNKGSLVRFVLPLGWQYKPEDILVKANVSGSRIRLLANKPVSYPDGSMRREQLNKRFLLPVSVDPYHVTAKLDIKGQLTVEALIAKTPSQNRS